MRAKGVQSTWDRLGNISAAVDVLKKLKKQVALAMETAYQGTKHKKPDIKPLVLRVAHKVHEEMLHSYKEDRIGNKKTKPVPDIIFTGQSKLKSSSLSTFNRKVRGMVEGREYDEDVEAESLPQNTIVFNSTDGDDDYSEDIVLDIVE